MCKGGIFKIGKHDFTFIREMRVSQITNYLYLYAVKRLNKDWELENNTNLNTFFYLVKSSEIVLIFLPAFC